MNQPACPIADDLALAIDRHELERPAMPTSAAKVQHILAGLIHNIGRLPLFLHIEKKNLNVDGPAMDTVIRRCSALVSERLLKIWEFPPEMVEIPLAHEDIHRETASPCASYADVVTIANMLSRATAKAVEWNKVTAVKRMGLDANLYREFFDRFDKDLAAAREMLN